MSANTTSSPFTNQSLWPLPAPLASWGSEAPQWPGPSASSAPLPEYLVDAWQRTVLFLETLRERGNEQEKITSSPLATVLIYDHEIILSGRSLERPINFSLSRIIPPEGTIIDPAKRPVVIVDPRAGQGPGIGGFKSVSEIGEAFEHGHAVYFIGFAAQPEPGQTFLDVVEGQVKFFEHVVARHPDAPKPLAIGNCQAGYQTLLVAVQRPDLFGVGMVAGSPMSYWQGVHGKNPMRYAGGMLGGSWLTELVSDLSGGKFDGTWLILNFDTLNLGNWLWSKQYEVYADVDSDQQRYLGFEKWWGDFIQLNGSEIQYLVDEMFIGDRLTRNELRGNDGTVFDLRNITSPILVLTSEGDNISPPPQTLGWILDLYKDVDELRAEGRTIVYCVNPTVGHLAIFVSAKVGGKEDEEMIRLVDVIELLPPGLYEMVITPTSEEEVKAGKLPWNTSFELRTFDNLRAYGRNTPEDDKAFAAVRRLSEINHSLYRTFLRPFVQTLSTPQLSDFILKSNPLRLSYTFFADGNPLMKPVAKLAEEARANRRPASETNPYLVLQKHVSDQINATLSAIGDARDKLIEQSFFNFYGNPVVQGLLGLNDGEPVRQLPPVSPEKREQRKRQAEAVTARISVGGYDEALVRSVLYVALAHHRFNDRTLLALNELGRSLTHLSLDKYKELVGAQFDVLMLDPAHDQAINALPELVSDAAARENLIKDTIEIVGANGVLTGPEEQRLDHVAQVLKVADEPDTAEQTKPVPALTGKASAKVTDGTRKAITTGTPVAE